jgi:chromosome segregation ATPase
MPDTIPASFTSFVVILAGSAIALAACGVLIGTLTHRYRNQALALARKYLGARDEHQNALNKLEKSLKQIEERKRENVLVSAQANANAALSAKFQDKLLAHERRINDLADENLDLKSQLGRASNALVEMEKLAKQQQEMLLQATEEVERARAAHYQARGAAQDKGTLVADLEKRLKHAQMELATAQKTSAHLQLHNNQLQQELATREQRLSATQRDALNMELKLASNAEKQRIADKASELHERHTKTIDDLTNNLAQLRGQLDDVERDRSLKAGDLTALSEKLAEAERNADTATAESRERLNVIQNLTQELNDTRLALRNAQLQVDQHEAMNKEQWARLQDAHDQLNEIRKESADREQVLARVNGTLRQAAERGDARARFVLAEFSNPENVLNDDEKQVVAKASAAPGGQTVLAKLAKELLNTQKKLASVQGSMEELKAQQAASSAQEFDAAELQDLREQLEKSRARQSDQSEKISSLVNKVRDLEKRYDEARSNGEDLRKAIGDLDAERTRLQQELAGRQSAPPAPVPEEAAAEVDPRDLPRFITETRELPRFVQQDERIEIEPPLESIRGLTARDINTLRAAAVMTVSDLAMLTPERLEGIIRPSLWRKPDYGLWIRQARQMQAKLSGMSERASGFSESNFAEG